MFASIQCEGRLKMTRLDEITERLSVQHHRIDINVRDCFWLVEKLREAIRVIEELQEELRWCSGSPDFNEGGQSRIGWVKGPQVTLEKTRAFLKELK